MNAPFRFFLPSWNGDFRLEGRGEKHPDQTVVIIEKATPAEQQFLAKFFALANTKKWTDDKYAAESFAKDIQIVIGVDVNTASKAIIKLARPAKETLTAVKFSNGKIEVAKGSDSKALHNLLAEQKKGAAAIGGEVSNPKPKAAVSVARPTPCCPQCIPGSVERASEVLLEFLNEEEHAQWAEHRAIIVKGGLSGHRYRLAHRNSKLGVAQTKICYDLDDRFVLHFHDWGVPPEEEVLASKLILEHAEPWLRNEATAFLAPSSLVFKNPFGNLADGVDSTMFTTALGGLLQPFAK